MPRPPGLPKTGGRKQGTPNRKTLALCEVFEGLAFSAPERLVALLPELEKGKQADILLGLLSYLYPKRRAVEVEAEVRSSERVAPEQSRAYLLEFLRDDEALAAIDLLDAKIDAIDKSRVNSNHG